MPPVVVANAGRDMVHTLRDAAARQRRFAVYLLRRTRERVAGLASFGESANAGIRCPFMERLQCPERWGTNLKAVPSACVATFAHISKAAQIAAPTVSWTLFVGAHIADLQPQVQAGLALEADWAFKTDMIKHEECDATPKTKAANSPCIVAGCCVCQGSGKLAASWRTRLLKALITLVPQARPFRARTPLGGQIRPVGDSGRIGHEQRRNEQKFGIPLVAS